MMSYFNVALQDLEWKPAPGSGSYSVTSVFTGRRSQAKAWSSATVNILDRIIEMMKLFLTVVFQMLFFF